jgi:2-C-methyl-D-erythritol 4-phosphate cytidylyltransferase
MRRFVIIVAGGSGRRMGSEVPKQFLRLAGKPLLMYTLARFHEWDAGAELVLVLPATYYIYWQQLCREFAFNLPYRVVEGGDTRFQSVSNALALLDGAEDALVAVHDGVRPFVSNEVITACFAEAERSGAALPVIKPIDSLRENLGSGFSRPVDRNHYFCVQTPQVFRLQLLKSAYKQTYRDSFTDDASVVEAAGSEVKMVDGDRDNIKITTPIDFLLGEALLSSFSKTHV